jgi:hypothetical protein
MPQRHARQIQGPGLHRVGGFSGPDQVSPHILMMMTMRGVGVVYA